jgi:hypothetical protein
MCAKWVILGGFGQEKRGKKGVFWPPEAGKKASFCVPEGCLACRERFPDQKRTLCLGEPPPENHPRGQLER